MPSTPETPNPEDARPEYLVIIDGESMEVLQRIPMQAELEEDSSLTYYTATFNGGTEYLRNGILSFYFQGGGYYWSNPFGTLTKTIFQNSTNGDAPDKDTRVIYPYKVTNWTGGELTFQLFPEQEHFASNLFYVSCPRQFFDKKDHNVSTYLEYKCGNGSWEEVFMWNTFDENTYEADIEITTKTTLFRVKQYCSDYSGIILCTTSNLELPELNSVDGEKLVYKVGYGKISNPDAVTAQCTVYVYAGTSGEIHIRRNK